MPNNELNISNSELSARFLRAKRTLFDKLYSFLNEKQREAVFTVNDPLLILAGAGSGKTTVLVQRIAFIVKYGNAYYENGDDITVQDVERLESAISLSNDEIREILSEYAVDKCPPWAMLSITFTNKAASEMKERLEKVLGEDGGAQDIWAGTFHSVCVRLLRRYGSAIELDKNFTIYDTDDSKKIIAQILKEINIDEKLLPPKMALNAISRAKDKLIDPESYVEQLSVSEKKDFRALQVAKVYKLYQEKLKAAGAVDFDDIITKTVDLLMKSEDVRTHLQRRFRYVCIDEYQDTNHAQFVLATLLSGGRRNLMVVGDDDQSIYKFRGATIENILDFDKVFPDAKVIKLEQNYRSTQIVLDAANAVIGNNVGRKGKKLWTAQGSGDAIELHKAHDQNEEATYIADTIMKLCASRQYKPSDIAILYRMNAQSNAMEKILSKSGVSYRVVGGTRFYDRKEIKDVLAYLQLVRNPDDDLRLRRVINEPKRKIGNTTIAAVSQIAATEQTSMFNVIKNAQNYVALQKSVASLTAFAGIIFELRKIAETESVSSLIEKTLDLSGYKKMLKSAGAAEADRVENVEELVSNAIEYESSTDEPTLDGFLEDVALVSDIDNFDTAANAVVMMTIHSAKGLEFPVVFLPGMENGIFPGVSALANKDELEEERRLAYVAITRAKEKLYLTYTKERMLFGRTQYNPVSQFIGEIPNKLIVDTTVEKVKLNSNFQIPGVKPKRPASEVIHEKTVFDIKPRNEIERFEIGDVVIHPTFGNGTVLSVRPMSSDTLYEIAFDSFGTKKLMATYAKLKKADTN